MVNAVTGRRIYIRINNSTVATFYNSNLGINSNTPARTLDVGGDVRIGTDGSTITSIKIVTGTTAAAAFTDVSYPSGWTRDNTQFVSGKIQQNATLDWWPISWYISSSDYSRVIFRSASIRVYHPDSTFQERPYEIVLMQV